MKRLLTLLLPVLVLILFSVLDYCGILPQDMPEPEPPAVIQEPTAPPVVTQPPEELNIPEEPEDPYPWLNDTLDLSAKYVFVYDCSTRRMLYSEGNLSEPIAMASLTKLFTAHVALQYLNPSSYVIAGDEAYMIAHDSSIANIQAGCALTVNMLIQGLLMQSGNDAAYILAAAAGRVIGGEHLNPYEAVSVFMKEMNSQAQSLGMKGTHFVTPDGYDAEGHYSTAEDLLTMACMAVQHPSIRHYTAIYRQDVLFLTGEQREWKNTNALVNPESEYYIPEAYGLKTGYTSTAGGCLITAFRVGVKDIVIGVMGCPVVEDRFRETVFLFHRFFPNSRPANSAVLEMQ